MKPPKTSLWEYVYSVEMTFEDGRREGKRETLEIDARGHSRPLHSGESWLMRFLRSHTAPFRHSNGGGEGRVLTGLEACHKALQTAYLKHIDYALGLGEMPATIRVTLETCGPSGMGAAEKVEFPTLEALRAGFPDSRQIK